MRIRLYVKIFVAVAVLLSLGTLATVAFADHSWGGYHWARTANPFTLKLGDNVSQAWDAHLALASDDWSTSSSSVLVATPVPGQTNPKNCRATSGRVEVCSSKYGNNGWLGLAQIWVSGSHITKGVAKMNDSYFTTTTYNTPAWRQLVMCQEIAHTFGLDHQDENFYNANLGTCMDYTADPDGPPSNEHPNTHDFDQLALIYAHPDSSTTVGADAPMGPGKSGLADIEVSRPSEWGKVLRQDGNGRPSLYGRDLGNGQKIFTFVIWAE